jgi:hypothetical protein
MGLFRTMLDEGGEVTEIPALDAQGAAEARELLNDFPATAALSWEKVRDGAHVAVHGAFFYDRDGHPVVVTPGEAALYDRAHALAHTVITQEAEVAALRTELARERAEHDHSCKALGVELQYTQERVAELHETLRAVARACTLPKDTTPAALPAQVEACIRDLSEQIERLTLAATDAEDALAGLVALKTAAARAYLEMDGGRTDAITPETDSGAEPRLALTFDLGGTEGDEPWQALVIYDAGMGTVPVTSGECCGTPLAAVASLREDLEPNHNDDTEDDCESVQWADGQSPHALIDEARRERDAALAIIEGRTVAPNDHELEVHAARGGRWRTRYQVGDPALCRDGMEAPEAREVRERMRPLHVYTWWATEADGTPCAWPVVTP